MEPLRPGQQGQSFIIDRGCAPVAQPTASRTVEAVGLPVPTFSEWSTALRKTSWASTTPVPTSSLVGTFLWSMGIQEAWQPQNDLRKD